MKFSLLRLSCIAPLMLFFTSCQITATDPTQQPAQNQSAEAIRAERNSTGTADTSTQSIAQTASYPRRPYKIRDQVSPNNSFYQFRERLKQAVRDRNAKFIRDIADPKIKITFGLPKPLSSLGFDNPNSLSWKRLERIITIGCTPYEAPAGVEIDAYQCPHISQAALGDPFSDVYIVGENVNIRAQPRAGSAIVGGLSDEVVKSDPEGLNRLTPQQRQEQQTFDGWQPIITPTGQRGYVSSRYAYYPAGYRARFENQKGQWKMTLFIAGD